MIAFLASYFAAVFGWIFENIAAVGLAYAAIGILLLAWILFRTALAAWVRRHIVAPDPAPTSSRLDRLDGRRW